MGRRSIGCGLAFGAALEPPGAPAHRGPDARWVLATVAVLFIVVFAGFINAVHLGYLVADADLAFTSHYRPEELRELSRDRVERWRDAPPTRLRRLSREDQYLDEGLWHIRERNRRWDAGEHGAALLENEILERYFAPVLDTRSYAAPDPSRWPEAQKADARQRATAPTSVSRAEPYPIVTAWAVTGWRFWGLVVVLMSLALVPVVRG